MLAIPARAELCLCPLKTEQLQLVPLEATDAEDFWSSVSSAREALEPWLPWVPFTDSLQACQRYVRACAVDWDAGRALRFALRSLHDQQLVGVVSFDHCNHHHRTAELGYWLHPSCWGRGWLTQAARAAVDFALRRAGFHRIRCAVATTNQASLAVVARLGFQPEGIARQAEWVQGRWVDHAVFSRLATDP